MNQALAEPVAHGITRYHTVSGFGFDGVLVWHGT